MLDALKNGMLCLADRKFFRFELWNRGRATGADLLWRIQKNARRPRETVLPDGSPLSRLFACDRERRGKTNGVTVRVIDDRLEGVTGAEPVDRLVTTLLDPDKTPATERAALDQERWEIETALEERNTHLHGARIVLRRKTADLVRPEFYGLMMAHVAIRGLMQDAALKAEEDPDRLSFLHAVRVIRRRLPPFLALPPSAQCSLS